jgi:hypothetical protein
LSPRLLEYSLCFSSYPIADLSAHKSPYSGVHPQSYPCAYQASYQYAYPSTREPTDRDAIPSSHTPPYHDANRPPNEATAQKVDFATECTSPFQRDVGTR